MIAPHLIDQERLKREADDFRESSKDSGKHYGYPQCCIDAFISETPAEMRLRTQTVDDLKRFRASHIDGKYTGFFPCTMHAEKILAGELQLKDLITDRDEKMKPFPEDWSMR